MTKSTTPKSPKKGAVHPVDVYVGAKLKDLRNLVGMSQKQLGEVSGLTFQQIQKYERGANRMAASRLLAFARALGVPVGEFFENITHSQPTPKKGFGEKKQDKFEGIMPEKTDKITQRETQNLIRAYYGIKDAKQRRIAYDLIKSIADKT